jgi:CBS domain-containing protein
VKDVMTAKPICVRPEAPLEEAANLLLRLKIRRLPVVDEAGKLAGGWVGAGGGGWGWGWAVGWETGGACGRPLCHSLRLQSKLHMLA